MFHGFRSYGIDPAVAIKIKMQTMNKFIIPVEATSSHELPGYRNLINIPSLMLPSHKDA